MSQYSGEKQKYNMFLHITFFFCILYIFFWENRYVVNTSITLVIIAGSSMLTIFSSPKFRLPKGSVVFFLIIIYALLGCLYTSENSGASIKWVQNLLIMFSVVLAFRGYALKIKTALIVFAVCSFVFMIGLYMQLFAPDIVDTINSMMLKGGSLKSNIQLYTYGYYCGFSGFNMVSALFCALLMFISLAAAYSSQKVGMQRSLLLTIAILAFVGIIIAQKRGVFVAALGALIVFMFIASKNKKFISRFLQISFIIVLFVLIMYFFLLNSESGKLFLERFNASDGDITSGRSDIIKKLLESFWSYVLFGNGTGSVLTLVSAGAHNIYLQLLYEGGIIGLILYIFFFGQNLLYALKLYSSCEWMPGKKTFLLSSISFQLVYLIYGLFGNPLSDIFLFLLYIVLSSIPYSPEFSIEEEGLK